MRNLAISEAASPYGLYYAPDPSSQIACTIGGNVAENSGGVHCLKYGLTVHNVLRVRAVTIDGDVVTVGWTYDADGQAVVFDADHIPESGSYIQVQYDLLGDCED